MEVKSKLPGGVCVKRWIGKRFFTVVMVAILMFGIVMTSHPAFIASAANYTSAVDYLVD